MQASRFFVVANLKEWMHATGRYGKLAGSVNWCRDGVIVTAVDPSFAGGERGVLATV